MNIVANALAQALQDIEPFSRLILKRPLRTYQLDPARAAVSSAIKRDGEQYVWRFPRQSGKNETLAHVHAYLLFLYQRVKGSSIVHTAPTYEPQAHNAQQRLLEITAGNPFFRGIRSAGNAVILGKARIVFLSGQERDKPNVGSTASLLLSKDECQDLSQRYIEQAFDPMTANTNAPHVHTGTARHDGTYLALKRKELEELERQDGKRRVFIINWRDVAKVNEAYGKNVEQVIAKKGALHPAVMSEYENIENEQTGRLFDDRRLCLIFSTDAPKRAYGPAPGAPERRGGPACPPSPQYIITLDVGGTDLQGPSTGSREAQSAGSPGPSGQREHDYTVAAVHQVTYTDSGLNIFTTLDYLTLQGANVLDDTQDRRRLFAYLDCWRPVRIVPDSTGLGVGLASVLISRYREKVVPFQFTSKTKSDLLDQWLALIETGRYHHFSAPNNGRCDPDYARFHEQLVKCQHEERPGGTIWGIPAEVSWRNPLSMKDEYLHDDHLIANALTAILADAELAPRIAESTPAPRRSRQPRPEDED